MSHTLGFGISQGGRYLRHFLSAGFNSDEEGRRVFDGMLAHSAGAGRLFFDVPFGQPFRTSTRHEDTDFPESWFPFSAARLADPLTGEAGSVMAGDGNDPKLIQTNTSSEYWQKGASLLHTDPLGRGDVVLPDHARVYLLAGTQHSGRAGLTTDPGPCAHPRNPHDPMPALRALLVALDEWVVEGRPAPASRVPSIGRGTLAPADAIGFPAIPGVAVAGRLNGIRPPPGAAGAYRPLVPCVDADGNETDGVLLPDVAVPLGTFTGWNLYRPPLPEGELADRDGSFLPFAPTAAARAAAGDPRPSLAERYPTTAAYLARVAADLRRPGRRPAAAGRRRRRLHGAGRGPDPQSGRSRKRARLPRMMARTWSSVRFLSWPRYGGRLGQALAVGEVGAEHDRLESRPPRRPGRRSPRGRARRSSAP